jgi:CubicO group peptidase (beta-lactamase class C family)
MEEQEAIRTALAYVPSYLEFQQAYHPFVGAQIAVRVDGELLLDHAVGLADIDNDVPMTTDHLFRIASHSKTFTGVAIMQLVEQGKLRLDDEARVHVPELDDVGVGTVTIREMLSHGSGMTRDGDNSDFWGLAKPFPDRDGLIATIREHGKVIEANEHFKYSNIAYSLLGLIIGAASGQPYREYVTRQIVDPLGLANTGPEYDESRAGDFAKGYTARAHGARRVEIEHIDTFAESSATGFYSTAADVTAYFDAHLDGDDRIITDASKRRMRQVQWTVSDEQAYGLGLGQTKENGRTYWGHGGGYPGHITMSRFDPERRLAISVLTNSIDGPAQALNTAVLRLIDLALETDAKAEERDSDQLAPFEGRFTTLWGVTDIVNLGGRLYALTPTLENPAATAIGLEVVSDTGLKVIDDPGYGGYGEVMRYTFADDGAVEWIRGASGQTMVPLDRFTLPEKVTRPVDH